MVQIKVSQTAKKLFVGLGLSVLIGIAPAQSWTVVSASDDAVFFVDASSIRVDGSFLRIWVMTDYERHPAWKSTIGANQVDCKEDKFRALQLTAFAGPKGTGTVLGEVSYPDAWRLTVPGSAWERMIRWVCSRR